MLQVYTYVYFRQFDDFLVTLQAQDDKFESLKKLTLLEQAYTQLRHKERDRMRQQDETAKEPNRRDTQQIKTVEKGKILQERRQERERRKTQEISLLKPSSSIGDEMSTQYASQTLPRRESRTGSIGSRDTASMMTETTVVDNSPSKTPQR